MMPIQKELTYVPPAWVLLPVLAMVALFLILWLIFTRESSKFFFFNINMNNFANFEFGLKAKKY
jgi:hypothetical protein